MKRHFLSILFVALVFALSAGIGELIIATSPSVETTYLDANGQEIYPSLVYRIIETLTSGMFNSLPAAMIVAVIFWFLAFALWMRDTERRRSYFFATVVGSVGGLVASCVLWPFVGGSLPPGFLSFALTGSVASVLAVRYRLLAC